VNVGEGKGAEVQPTNKRKITPTHKRSFIGCLVQIVTT
jgi:hypothetical protein